MVFGDNTAYQLTWSVFDKDITSVCDTRASISCNVHTNVVTQLIFTLTIHTMSRFQSF